MALRACRIRFVTGKKRQKEKHALHRGNPRVEPAAVHGGWSDTVPVRRAESRNEGDTRNLEKKGLASRGDVKSKGWTFKRDWTNSKSI